MFRRHRWPETYVRARLFGSRAREVVDFSALETMDRGRTLEGPPSPRAVQCSVCKPPTTLRLHRPASAPEHRATDCPAPTLRSGHGACDANLRGCPRPRLFTATAWSHCPVQSLWCWSGHGARPVGPVHMLTCCGLWGLARRQQQPPLRRPACVRASSEASLRRVRPKLHDFLPPLCLAFLL
jgi:hypothetical protein